MRHPQPFEPGPNLPGILQKETPPPPIHPPPQSMRQGSAGWLLMPPCCQGWPHCMEAPEVRTVQFAAKWSTKIRFIRQKNPWSPPRHVSLEVLSAQPPPTLNSLGKKTSLNLRGRQSNAGEKPQQCPLISIFQPIRCYAVSRPTEWFFTVD